MSLFWSVALVFAGATIVPIHYADVPGPLLRHIPAGSSDFDAYVARIERETKERVAAGEDEALAYFVLQSSVFTKAPAIEPAVSAREYFANAEALPQNVVARFKDFLRALEQPSPDSRMRYFQRTLPQAARTRAYFESAYRRAAEFARRQDYASRGYSSDTRLASSFTVWNALGVLKSSFPKITVSRVLIVGPGADFAPRTDFRDDPPQSYQPIAIANGLFEFGLARPGNLEVVCVDVNDRVLDTVRSTRRPRVIAELGTEDFMHYQKRLAVAPEPSARISAIRLNVITERLSGEPFDLVIATNVLLYFQLPELALALSNIGAMTHTGGFFVHNDVRPEAETYANEIGLKWIQARRIPIAQGAKAPLYDTFSILRK